MTLPQLHAIALTTIQKFFAQHGGTPTMFFALDAKGELHLLPAPHYAEHRDFYAKLLQAYFLTHGVLAYAFASEAWMTLEKVNPGEPLPVERTPSGGLRMTNGLRPSTHPKRVEALMVCAVSRNHQVLQFCNRIVRDGEKVEIGESLMEPEGAPVAERAGLYGLFQPGNDVLWVSRLASLIKQGEVPLNEFFPAMRIVDLSAN